MDMKETVSTEFFWTMERLSVEAMFISKNEFQQTSKDNMKILVLLCHPNDNVPAIMELN